MARHRLTRSDLRTTYRVEGADAVDEFRALCFLLGRRPYQLVTELVNAGIAQLYAADPSLADDVDQLVTIARTHQREREIHLLKCPVGG